MRRRLHAFVAPPLLFCLIFNLLSSSLASGAAFFALEEIPGLAFPKATRTEIINLFLEPEERARIEQAAGTKLDSDMLSVHVGWQDEVVLGYAVLDNHMVRTLPQALLIVINPDGDVERTHVLAFYEPLEYLTSDRWLATLSGETLAPDLRLGRNITSITGSTLSSVAVVNCVRRALATYQELVVRSARLPR